MRLILNILALFAVSQAQLRDCIFDNTIDVYQMQMAPIYGYGSSGFDLTDPSTCIFSCVGSTSVRLAVNFNLTTDAAMMRKSRTKKMVMPGQMNDDHFCKDDSVRQQIEYAVQHNNITDPQLAADTILTQIYRPGWIVVAVLKNNDLATFEGTSGFDDMNLCTHIFDTTADSYDYFWHVVAGLAKVDD